jgi:hypothetical protein
MALLPLFRRIPAVTALLAAATLVSPMIASGATGAPFPVADQARVVPGLTGPAAQNAAGVAADRFRQLTVARTSAARTSAARVGTTQRYAAQASTLHTSWGLNLPSNVSKGLQATQSVVAGAAATTGGDFVYAPTAIPAGGACIEITTAYTPSGPDLWAWDWCGGRDGVGKLTAMNSAFLTTYTATVNGHPAYNLDEHQTDAASNTWTAYLYNFQTHAWDTFFTSSGTYDLPQYPFGWDMFEVYTTPNPTTGAGYYCKDMAGKIFESSGIKVLAGSSWTAAASGNSSFDSVPPVPGGNLDCPALNLAIVHPNDDWTGTIGGSTPQQNSYEAEASGNTLGGQAAARSSTNASGGALVGYVGNGTADYLQFNNVSVGKAGTHTVTVYYASGENRSVTISANGGTGVTVSTPSSGGWDTIASVSATLTLNAGPNTLRLGNAAGWAPDLDRIIVD